MLIKCYFFYFYPISSWSSWVHVLRAGVLPHREDGVALPPCEIWLASPVFTQQSHWTIVPLILHALHHESLCKTGGGKYENKPFSSAYLKSGHGAAAEAGKPIPPSCHLLQLIQGSIMLFPGHLMDVISPAHPRFTLGPPPSYGNKRVNQWKHKNAKVILFI